MLTRRDVLYLGSAALSAKAFPSIGVQQSEEEKEKKAVPGNLPNGYPAYQADLIAKLVTVSHFSLDKVKEVVGPHPQLAKASWDWGFGDWETPLGAACHMGRKDIVDYLLSAGATPSIFSATLAGDLPLVKQIVERHPGMQRVGGPHSISLLAHARMGGKSAEKVFDYLHSLGDADMAAPVALSEDERKLICGSYRAGLDPSQSVEVSDDVHGYANTPMYTYPPQLNWKRNGTMARPLFHLGGMTFHPAGAPSIRIRFEHGEQAVTMTVTDGDDVVKASRTLAV